MKQKINIKYFMVAYVGFILLFSSLSLGDSARLWKGLLIVLLYSGFDLLWTRLRDKTWYLPSSSWISGLILSVVAIPNPPLLLVVLLPFLAVASKQLLHFGKNRHIFNPASFGMAAVAFFTPSVSWWGVAWGITPLIIVSAVGLFILWRQNRWHITIPFLVSYAFFLSLLFLWTGSSVSELPAILKPQLIDGTALFFATVMLIEPITTTFPGRNAGLMYGALVGLSAVLVTYLSTLFPAGANMDPLVGGLLIGNFLVSMAFLPSQKRPAPQPAGPLNKNNFSGV